MKMKRIEKKGVSAKKRISVGPKGIVAIRTSMGAGDFKKQGWEWKREELTVKDQRTNYKILSN
ncbi:hypothetical protein M077_4307 [Bacteroides fragilis str. 2-F-2 |nr:hypothetical protein M077_4309 [Bacteroides fragilis str. 2-F-2 \